MRSGRILLFIAMYAGALAGGSSARATGSATNINGLYYTGLNSTGGLQAGGGRDANWDVTYAYAGGTVYSGSSTYTSAAGGYVLSSTANSGGTANYIDGAYTPNTSSAQWITAPGAMTTGTGGTVNVGGDNLPGNGTTGTNAAFYVYQLAFTISGTGSGIATNAINISLTIAADDAYSIYVTNAPITVNSDGTLNTGTYRNTSNRNVAFSSSASGTSAWNNTTAVNLQNGTDGTGSSGNTVFSISTNYLTIVVNNTNSQTGNSSLNSINPSGLLVYQVGAVATINGNPIPEVASWMPVFCAVGLYGAFAWRRSRMRNQLEAAC